MRDSISEQAFKRGYEAGEALQPKEAAIAFITFLGVLLIAIIIIFKLTRWWFKINQQAEQIHFMKEESAKTAVLVGKLAEELKKFNEGLYREREELMKDHQN